jgi:hypothetical protein
MVTKKLYCKTPGTLTVPANEMRIEIWIYTAMTVSNCHFSIDTATSWLIGQKNRSENNITIQQYTNELLKKARINYLL